MISIETQNCFCEGQALVALPGPTGLCKCLFRNNTDVIFATCGLRNVSQTAEVCFNEYVELVHEVEWPHFLTFRSTLQTSFVLVSRFV